MVVCVLIGVLDGVAASVFCFLVFIVDGRVAALGRGLGEFPSLGFPYVVCVLPLNNLWHPVVFAVAAVCVA